MSEYQIGQPVIATVCGKPGVRLMRIKPISVDYVWMAAEPVTKIGHVRFRDCDLTNVRPLALLDPEDEAQMLWLTELLDWDEGDLRALRVKNAVREMATASTQPSVGEHIQVRSKEDGEMAEFVRVSDRLWVQVGTGHQMTWEVLIKGYNLGLEG